MGFCLSQELLVPKLVQENEQDFFLDSLRLILRRDFPLTLPPAIKVGNWSRPDMDRIMRRLDDLQEATGLSDEDVRTILDNSNLGEEDRKKKLVLGYWCSQDLSSPRDPCEVLQRLRVRRIQQTPAMILYSNCESVEHGPLLLRSDYQELFKFLNTRKDQDLPPLERSAKYILSQDLQVPRLALDNEQNYFIESLRGIQRQCLDRKLPTDIKVGRWSQKDKNRAAENLKQLQEASALSSDDLVLIFDNSSLTQVEIRMKSLVGHWCSRRVNILRMKFKDRFSV